MSTPTPYPAYHDLALLDTTSAAHCRRNCGFETEYSGVGGPKNKFPAVLHAMLERADSDGFADVISWQAHGRAFKTHDHVALEDEVVPRYFRRPIKYTSFQRQLHLYGFLQLSYKGSDGGCYYHECFLRGRSDLCSLMQRNTKAPSHVRQSRDPATAPNFAALPTPEEANALLVDVNSHDSVCLLNARDSINLTSTAHPLPNVSALYGNRLLSLDQMSYLGHSVRLARNINGSTTTGHEQTQEMARCKDDSRRVCMPPPDQPVHWDKSEIDFFCSLPWSAAMARPSVEHVAIDTTLTPGGLTNQDVAVPPMLTAGVQPNMPTDNGTVLGLASSRTAPIAMHETMPFEEPVGANLTKAAASSLAPETDHAEEETTNVAACTNERIAPTNDGVPFSWTNKLRALVEELKR